LARIGRPVAVREAAIVQLLEPSAAWSSIAWAS
jgi:hypothetical protein